MAREPLMVDGKPVLFFDPNDYCGKEECDLCRGKAWVADEGHELRVGMEVGIAWYFEEFPDPGLIFWTTIAGRDERYGWYVGL